MPQLSKPAQLGPIPLPALTVAQRADSHMSTDLASVIASAIIMLAVVIKAAR